MACLMNLSQPLSLLKISARRFGSVLWSQKENRDLILSFHPHTLRMKWEESLSILNNIIIKVEDQLEAIRLPKELKEEVKPLIRPYGLEILKWLNYYNNYMHCVEYEYDLDELSWTYQGTIDYEQTIKNIVYHKNLNLIAQYLHCCLFCLVDDMQVVIRNLTLEEKMFCFDLRTYNIHHEGILNYWTSIFCRDFTAPFDCMYIANLKNCNIYQFAFECAAVNGNLVATRYFVSKLMFNEKESMLRTIHRIGKKIKFGIAPELAGFPDACIRDVFFFLLTQFKEEEQLEFFQQYPEAILRCCIDWPRQNVIYKVLEQLWSVLPLDTYIIVMSKMAFDMYDSAYDYPKLFREIFKLSPLPYKRALLQKQCETDIFLAFLFDFNDIESIKAVLRFADSETKENIFNSTPGFSICVGLLLNDLMDMLEFFINVCALSKDTKSKVIEAFKEIIPKINVSGHKLVSLKSNAKKFYNMLLPDTPSPKQQITHSLRRSSRLKQSNHKA